MVALCNGASLPKSKPPGLNSTDAVSQSLEPNLFVRLAVTFRFS